MCPDALCLADKILAYLSPRAEETTAYTRVRERALQTDSSFFAPHLLLVDALLERPPLHSEMPSVRALRKDWHSTIDERARSAHS